MKITNDVTIYGKSTFVDSSIYLSTDPSIYITIDSSELLFSDKINGAKKLSELGGGGATYYGGDNIEITVDNSIRVTDNVTLTGTLNANELHLDASTHRIYADASNMYFEDPSAGTQTLSSLIGGGGGTTYYAGDNIEITADSSIRVTDDVSLAGTIYAADNFKWKDGSTYLAIGKNAGTPNKNEFVAVGIAAAFNATGDDYTAIGKGSGYQAGDRFTSVGKSAGQDADSNFVAVGYYAGTDTTGSGFVAVGYASSAQTTSLANCTAIGYLSGYQSDSNFTAVGSKSGQLAVSYFSTVGYNAGFNSGSYFNAVGYYAGQNSGSYFEAMGYDAGRYAGSYFTAMGYYAGRNATNNFVATGYQAGYQSNSNFIAIGYNAGNGNDGTTYNISDFVAIGYNARAKYAGHFVLQQYNINTSPLIEGNFNTGDVSINGALKSTEFRIDTSAYRIYADASNMYFEDPSAGTQTLSNLIGGGGSGVSFGSENEIPVVNSAGNDFVYTNNFRYDGTRLIVYQDQTYYNVFIGDGAGDPSTTGDLNTAVGIGAGGSLTTGGSNVLYGRNSGFNITDGGGNTLVGQIVMSSDSSRNVVIGHHVDSAASRGSGNVFIGYNAADTETGSNKLYIANSNTSTSLIYGMFDVSVLRINEKLGVGRYIDDSSIGDYSFAGGKGYVSDSKEIIASGQTSFNFSENTTSQTDGYGALAPNSAILGGLDLHIAESNTIASIIGSNRAQILGNNNPGAIYNSIFCHLGGNSADSNQFNAIISGGSSSINSSNSTSGGDKLYNTILGAGSSSIAESGVAGTTIDTNYNSVISSLSSDVQYMNLYSTIIGSYSGTIQSSDDASSNRHKAIITSNNSIIDGAHQFVNMIGVDSVTSDQSNTTYMENVSIQSDRAFYLGMPSSSGTFRMRIDSSYMYIERYNGSTWDTAQWDSTNHRFYVP